MTYPFPPQPPGYSIVVLTRWILFALAAIGIVIVAHRLRHWKSVWPREIVYWSLAGGLSWLLGSLFGVCFYTYADDNEWLVTAITGTFAASCAGITICLCKIYVEGTSAEKWRWFTPVVIGSGLLSFWFLITTGACVYPREAGARSQCKNNLKLIGLAMHNYHDEESSFPPAVQGSTPLSWRITILPFLDERVPRNSYDSRFAWDQPPNAVLAEVRINCYICPTNYYPKDSRHRWFTAYSMPTGSGTIGANPAGTKIKFIRDGTSNTLLVVEACGSEIVWTEPRDVDASNQSTGINLPGDQPGHSTGWLSSFHVRGAHALIADGSVRMFTDKSDPELLKKLSTIDGGEAVDLDR